MPKVTTINASFDMEERGLFKFKYDVNVDSSGTFSAMLPEDVALKLKDAGIRVGYNRNKKIGYVSSSSLDGLVKDVKALIYEYCSSEVIENKNIIMYSMGASGSYWVNTKGDVCPNGGFDQTGESLYEQPPGTGWHNSPSVGDTDIYSAHVRVLVLNKKVELFRSGNKKTTYTRPKFEKEEVGPELFWLSGLNGAFGHFDKRSSFEIEANEQNATFFVSLIKGMIKMGEKIRAISSPEVVEELAAAKQFLLQ